MSTVFSMRRKKATMGYQPINTEQREGGGGGLRRRSEGGERVIWNARCASTFLLIMQKMYLQGPYRPSAGCRVRYYIISPYGPL